MIFEYYPELQETEHTTIVPGDEYFDVLILGGSVLNKDFSPVGRFIKDNNKRIRIHNLAIPAHTSLDSRIKYSYLKDTAFDFVVFYHGINETRTNNCPQDVFDADYNHVRWYEEINTLRTSAVNVSVIPFAIKQWLHSVSRSLGIKQYIPMEFPRRDWMRYGSDVKSAASFKFNVLEIVNLANKNKTPLLLLSFAYYVLDDYSLDKFLGGELDYATRPDASGTRGTPIEIWGQPKNVEQGILAHNQALREISASQEQVHFLDMNQLLPKSKEYFNDVCHLTRKGSRFLAERVSTVVAQFL